jgi:predicted enzyme related to lactoylglutathione lyase
MVFERINAAITFLKTTDLEKTTHFYQDVLKLKLVLDQGTCRIFRILRGSYIGFCIQDKEPDNREVVITLVVEDVDAACSALEKGGCANRGAASLQRALPNISMLCPRPQWLPDRNSTLSRPGLGGDIIVVGVDAGS